MTTYLILSLLTGSGHIASEYKKHYPIIYTLKPLTIFIIIVAVVMLSPMDAYARWILIGLTFSMLGDIFLMLKQQRFIAGLVSFLIAHILYIIGFYNQLTTTPQILHLLYFALPALAMFAFLYPGLGKLKLPVLIYIGAILLMAFFSLEVYLATPTGFTLAAFFGALVFMVSDATLAINKFRLPFKAAQLVILSTYYIAQWLIAYSTFN